MLKNHPYPPPFDKSIGLLTTTGYTYIAPYFIYDIYTFIAINCNSKLQKIIIEAIAYWQDSTYI